MNGEETMDDVEDGKEKAREGGEGESKMDRVS